MIPLDKIVISKMAFDDGSIEYKALLEVRAYHRLTPRMIQDVKDLDGMKGAVKQELQQRIWHEMYGSLRDSVFKLITEAKYSFDPTLNSGALDKAIEDLESKFK